MSEDDRRYWIDLLTGWRRGTPWEASQIFLRLFTTINILFVVIDAAWNGDADFRAAFIFSFVAAAILALLSMVFKAIPMFDE